MKARVRRRLAAHAWAFFLFWPAASALAALFRLYEVVAVLFGSSPAASGASMRSLVPLLREIVPASCLGLGLMLPEFLAAGAFFWIVSVLIFGGLACALKEDKSARWIAAEPVLAACAAFVGVVWDYPAALRHPFLFFLRELPAGAAAVLLTLCVASAAAVLGAKRAGGKGAAGIAAMSIAIALAFRGLCAFPIRGRPAAPPSGSILILGIDSLSQFDDVAPLRELVRREQGLWFEKPVTPAYFTNAVWTSILARRPPRGTGVHFLWQSFPWDTEPSGLLRRAKSGGFLTWSRFSNQFTCPVGSEAGFDFDRSGPKGWRQMLSALEDASVFLPVVEMRLGLNRAGTYTYDLAGDIRSMLTTGARGRKNLVAAHIEYLHDPQYPAQHLLSPAERAAVWKAPVRSLRDSSLDWQYPEAADEPLGLYRWKIRFLQKTIADELAATGYLKGGNRLVLFSDHGSRRGLNAANFCEPRYHRVVLAAFGAPRRDGARPISLIDVGALAGLEGASPAEPAASYAFPERIEDWLGGHRLKADGGVVLSQGLQEELKRRLAECRPYGRR